LSRTEDRKAKRPWGRRGRRPSTAVEAEEIPVRWHASDALPGSVPPPRSESARIRGPELPEESTTTSGDRLSEGSQPPPPPPPRRGGGRHRVKRKLWAPAPKSPRRGSRREAVKKRRRETRRRLAQRVRPAAVVLLAVALAGGAWIYLRTGDPGTDRGAGSSAGLPTVTTTALIAGTEKAGHEATWLALLSFNPAKDRAAIVYIPAHTAVEVPGRGLQGLGGSITGGLDLLTVSAHNLFPGLHITDVGELTKADVTTFFAEAGPLAVDIPTEVRVGTEDNASVLFPAGLQELSAESIGDLLYTKGFEDDDVDLGARQLAVWDSLFDSYRAAPEALSVALERAELDRDTTTGLAELLGRIAALPSSRLTLTVLPVEQVGVAGSELYDTSEEELRGFVDQTLSGTGTAEEVSVQVLNGVGSPGLGERVAKDLVGEGYRVTLTGNVPGFGEAKTLIVTYDASPDGIAAAERARDLLGTGEVQVSGQGRVSVDLTVVVGKDFLKR
jgi:hypothetical protein